MRLIDANLATEQIKKSDLTNREKIALLLCLSSIPTITPPSNDPLTLEQLREMDGEPVWCVVYNLPKGGYYCLCDRGEILCPSGNRFDCKDISDWTFYRSRPEEVSTSSDGETGRQMDNEPWKDFLRDRFEGRE